MVSLNFIDYVILLNFKKSHLTQVLSKIIYWICNTIVLGL